MKPERPIPPPTDELKAMCDAENQFDKRIIKRRVDYASMHLSEFTCCDDMRRPVLCLGMYFVTQRSLPGTDRQLRAQVRI